VLKLNLVQLIIILFTSAYFGQEWDNKYQPSNIRSSPYNRVYEANLIDKDQPVRIYLSEQKESNILEVRIVEVNDSVHMLEQVIDIQNYSLEGLFFYALDVLVFDYDLDDLDEVILSIPYHDRIKLIEVSAINGVINYNEIFTIKYAPTTKANYIRFTPAQLDEDKPLELVITKVSNYPEEGSLRGIFAIDIQTRKQLWFYPTAEYIYHIPVAAQSENGNTLIVFSSSASSNGMYFSEGSFYKSTENVLIPYSTYYTKSSTNKLNRNSEDFSSDSNASIFALNSNGEKIWRKIVGEEFFWVKLSKFANGKIVAHGKNRNSKISNPDFLRIVDPLTGNLLKGINFDENTTSNFDIANSKLFLQLQPGKIKVYNDELIWLKDIQLSTKFST
jgi:hypothetical protein